MVENRNAIGIIGLGVMGKNFAFNMIEHGVTVAGYDADNIKLLQLSNEIGNSSLQVFNSIDDMLKSLQVPRVILLLVPAGHIVDNVIAELRLKLSRDDLIIDSGNSHFLDTNLRMRALLDHGIYFLGMGLSGGEKGARFGPCMMFGGDRAIYARVRNIFEKCAAQIDHEPCVAYLGSGSAGHYVKMVHNGIEYGILQLIAETYDLMKRALGLDDASIADLYYQWNRTELESFLLENATVVFRKIDIKTGLPLIDQILDEAKQKGTCRWASQDAMELQVPIPTIDIAVSARNFSLCKENRSHASKLFESQERFHGNNQSFLRILQNAYYTSALITYGQGFSLLTNASKHYQYNFDLETIARIWRGGCIIRAKHLELIRSAYRENWALSNLLLDSRIALEMSKRIDDLREVVTVAVRVGIPIPAFSASLSYFDSLRSEWLPANLIQALRDDFGAHTYERVDERGNFHTQWTENPGDI